MAATTKTKGMRLLKADRAVYDVLHLGWRAGYVYDFYCGRRSPSDPTIVWTLDGNEYPHDERDVVLAAAEDLRVAAGVERVELGPTWCGFPQLTVRYLDGRSRTEHFDRRIVTTFTRAGETLALAPIVHGVDVLEPVVTVCAENGVNVNGAPRQNFARFEKGVKPKVARAPKPVAPVVAPPERVEQPTRVPSARCGVDAGTRALIVSMRADGASFGAIAKTYGLPISTVRRTWRKGTAELAR